MWNNSHTTRQSASQPAIYIYVHTHSAATATALCCAVLSWAVVVWRPNQPVDSTAERSLLAWFQSAMCNERVNISDGLAVISFHFQLFVYFRLEHCFFSFFFWLFCSYRIFGSVDSIRSIFTFLCSHFIHLPLSIVCMWCNTFFIHLWTKLEFLNLVSVCSSFAWKQKIETQVLPSISIWCII